ncbi:PREDICTED: selenoprotein M isoform X1 [Chinchilla lanigera]|uniref:selenoprotein M isoform X1 n=1 Tax=Chinchilla lanigera TaxID=34839 RepID=UPI000698B302|nr:PREDICTED: selenoprotein M isoform X1 [Chinchilla lanigera]
MVAMAIRVEGVASGGGGASLRAQTWRRGPVVRLQPADHFLPGSNGPPAVAAAAAVAASRGACGPSHRRHQLSAELEPSARPGPGPGRDLWRMTAEPPKGGEGLRHRGHSIVPQPGDETPPWGRPRTCTAGPTLPGTRARPAEPNDQRRDQRADAGARLLPQEVARRAGAPRVPVGTR